MARILVANAWPYSNGPFHLGHLAGAYLPGDIFARFHRLRGNEVLMVSGSDMHGTPTLVTAEREGVTPEEVANRYHAINRAAFERLGVSYDVYTHTHTLVHEKTVQELFLALLENGFVRRRTAEGAYCPKHRRFLPDRYLTGTCPHCGFEKARGDECDQCGRPLEPRELIGPRCALCGTPAEFRNSEHFYLELDRLQPKLAEYLTRQPHWRAGTLRVAENFLAEGLHPTPITRDLDWGVPIPLDGYATKRFYVWFDAVSGYLSASREWAIRTGAPDAWRKFWDAGEPVRQYYFVGKDNRFHHTIIWPAMLLGVGGYALPYDVPANEWLRVHGGRISKSRTEDQAVFVPSLLEKYPPDVIRFYAAHLAPQHHDTELNWEEFHKLRDEVLANQYGNLVQRCLVLARDRYEGRIPAAPATAGGGGSDGVAPRLRSAHEGITEEFERVHLKEALDLALSEVREANRRFHDARPWQAGEPERARVIYETIWTLKALALWLAPVLPFSSAEVFRMIGESAPPAPGDWDRALEPPPPGRPLGEIRPLFPRPEAGAPPAPSVATAAPPAAPSGPVPLSIRVAVVRSVANHPAADKLYVLELDVGEPTPRTVVAGLRSSYPAEALRGRRVALLANLAPRTIRRMTSQGMILAADHDDRAVLVEPPAAAAPGAYIHGAGPADRTISYDEFAAEALRVGRVEGPAEGGGSRVVVGETTRVVRGTWPTGAHVVVRLSASDPASAEVVEFGPAGPAQLDPAVPPGARIR